MGLVDERAIGGCVGEVTFREATDNDSLGLQGVEEERPWRNVDLLEKCGHGTIVQGQVNLPPRALEKVSSMCHKLTKFMKSINPRITIDQKLLWLRFD
ncbi:hypothetical protein R1sor_023716 [Riccia sorocarpa]|uniref:Uncharacterized protein n=1 Tax=Riccia sorocarpa TaxID=122646 RepID=A0ABD3GNG2_9MARC